MTIRLGRWTGLVALLLAALIGAFGYHFYRERYAVEKQDGEVLAGVVTAAFASRSDLRVGSISGTVQSKAEDVNALGIRTTQVMKAPYAVDYFVDLSKLSLRDYAWNQEARTLTVRLPPVVAARINIDESRRTMVRTGGLYVSRNAAERLTQRVSARAQALAKAKAEEPEQIAKARANAREVVPALLRPALAVSGLDGVRVRVVFADEIDRTNADRWDVTRSLQEVLTDPKYG